MDVDRGSGCVRSIIARHYDPDSLFHDFVLSLESNNTNNLATSWCSLRYEQERIDQRSPGFASEIGSFIIIGIRSGGRILDFDPFDRDCCSVVTIDTPSLKSTKSSQLDGKCIYTGWTSRYDPNDGRPSRRSGRTSVFASPLHQARHQQQHRRQLDHRSWLLGPPSLARQRYSFTSCPSCRLTRLSMPSGCAGIGRGWPRIRACGGRCI